MQNLYEAVIGKKNQGYYLGKFNQLDLQGQGLQASWNWPAFFCGGVWALYRKMYGWFAAFIGVAFLSNILGRIGLDTLGSLLVLIAQIAFAVLADSLYHQSVRGKIASAQQSPLDESRVLAQLRDKGGVHAWVVWVFGVVPFVGILAAILIPLFAR